MTIISYTLNREYRVVRNRIHGCYSLVKCKNTGRIKRNNVSSRDVTDQLWWRQNAKSEKTVLGDNAHVSDRWLFLAELCVQKISAHKK